MNKRFERYNRIDLPPPAKSEISQDGLRYMAKPPGAVFGGATSGYSGAMMSCFFCGTHRSSAARTNQKVLGRMQAVCNPPCAKNARALKALEAERIDQAAPEQAAA